MKGENVSVEIKFFETSYGDNLNIKFLNAQLPTFKVLLKDSEAVCFYDILEKVKSLSPGEEKSKIPEMISISKLLYVNPATSSTGETPFPATRRLKTMLNHIFRLVVNVYYIDRSC